MNALAELDAAIERYRRATRTIGMNLADLERDARYQLLQAAALTGTTATTWAEAKQSLGNLWQWYARLTSFVDEVVNQRGSRSHLDARREQELGIFLSGPSIELAHVDISVRNRPLLGDRDETTHCTADQLLDAMSAHFEWVRGVIVTTTETWDRVVPRMQRMTGELDAAASSAGELGDDVGRTIRDLRSSADRLAEAVASDPLGVDVADLDALERDVTGLQEDLAAAVSLRENVGARVACARATLAELEEAEDLVELAYREVRKKIAGATVDIPHATGTTLAAQLEAAIGACDERRWHDAQRALEAWTRSAHEAMLRARSELDVTRAPLDERNELRGRLDAYMAMAHRIGAAEDPKISKLYERARDELYTAPTDVAHAHELVAAYQYALSTRRAEQGERR